MEQPAKPTSLSPRSFTVLALLGFASGLPLFLTGSTLKAWMTDAGLDLRVIGMFGLVAQPYVLKVFWAPFLDRYCPPVLGRRRGWMAFFQAGLVVLLVLMALGDPQVGVARFVVLGFLVAFASASQDVALDAWRAEAFPSHQLGLANAIHVGFYRVAMLVSGALGLVLAQQLGWRAMYLIMAALMALGALGTLLAWSTDDRIRPPRSLKEAVVDPFRQFLKRPAALEVLAFILLYKIGDQLADAMVTPFLMRGLGFSKMEIGVTTKFTGMGCLILGGLIGGMFMKRWSLKRALLVFGLCQAGSILAFWALSLLGRNLGALAGAIALEHLCYGMGGTAFATFLMCLCDKRFTGTQYALFTSIVAFSRGYLSAPSGWAVLRLGWSSYFLACVFIAIPGLLLLARYDRWAIPEDSG